MTEMPHIEGIADFEDRVIRVCEFVGHDGAIRGLTFRRCDVQGPAVIVFRGEVAMTDSTWDGTAEAILWEIAPHRDEIAGAVLIEDCIFEGCTFRRLGIADGPEMMANIRRQFGL
jgi:hypothetical protein